MIRPTFRLFSIAVFVVAVPIGLLAQVEMEAGRPMRPGKARWSVKTSVAPVKRTANVTLTYEAMAGLKNVPGVTKNDARFDSKLIPASMTGGQPEEGATVTFRGWLHVVAMEDDGDYHVQISGSQQSGDGCVVVEVPNPDPRYVASAGLRAKAKAVRDLISAKLLRGKQPSSGGNIMIHPVYVQVTGQLFYDDAHVGDPPRGKRGMKAATLWEIHPVTSIAIVPKTAIPQLAAVPTTTDAKIEPVVAHPQR